ncbi:MAG: hypothetical protein HW387_1481 [Parachlamydiales bacterium]|nr:hypothetical protein [Parachlamydiales bacterium]
MGDRVIEPSEIITGRDETPRRNLAKSNPWLRLIARFFDYSLFFTLLRFLPNSTISVPFESVIPLEFLAWVPVETVFLALLGTTPGKWLLCTDLKKGHAPRLPFSCAFKRSLSVWIRGLGLCIPVINMICMANAYYRLRLFQTTSWDRDEGTTVIHRPCPKWRLYTVSAITVVGMILYSCWKKSWI